MNCITNYSIWLNIASISFQLAGALLLLVFFISTKRSKVIRRFLNNGFISKDGTTNELHYKEDVFKNCFAEAYMGKCSFFYIAFGYFLSIFLSNNNESYFVKLLSIIIITALLMIFALCIVKVLVLFNKEAKRRITDEELKELGIEPDMTSISDSEVDDIFHDVYGDDYEMIKNNISKKEKR